MPLIEEIPTTAVARVSHGWAYVPDVGKPIAAVQPGTRKRGAARERVGGRVDPSAKQQKVIQQRLADLDRENHKDVAIPIPAKKDRTKKISANVRRILTYQRNFAHYLADEEAQLSQSGGSNTVTLPPAPSQRTAESKRKESGSTFRRASAQQQQQHQQLLPMHPPPRPRGASATTIKTEPSNSSLPPSASPAQKTSASTTSTSTSTRPHPRPFSSSALELDHDDLPDPEKDPLLRTLNLPKPPSSRVMDALLAELPLTYNAARATVPVVDNGDASKPPPPPPEASAPSVVTGAK